MKILFKNHLENAIEALRANRLRTVLTIVGVTIGVASIAVVLSLSSGAEQFFKNQATEVSDSIAIIRTKPADTISASLLADFQSLHTTTTLTEKDVQDLIKSSDSAVAPLAVLHTSLSAKDDKVDRQHSTLVGTNTHLPSITDLELLDGQFLPSDTTTSGVVVGYQLAIDLFGTEHAIGNVLKARDQTFTVVGVLKATNQPINYLGVNFDRSAIISLDGIKQLTEKSTQIQQIVIKSSDINSTISKSQKILLENHQEEDFVILTGEQITSPNSQLLGSASITIALIAGVALVVGGIGIMNIMLVNVAERTREIGIRKAIGATNSNIISQFLIESAIIGLFGGLSGYALGLLIAFGFSLYLPFTPQITWQITLVSVLVAVIVGIFFGIYPAIQASRKDPIESLRQ